MNTAAPDVSRLEELALAWFFTREKGTRAGLSKALWTYVEAWWTPGEWNAQLDALMAKLTEAQQVARVGKSSAFQLTRRGQAQARKVLGVKSAPDVTNKWEQVQQKQLVSRALGLKAPGKPKRKTEPVNEDEWLVATLVKRGQKLPGPETLTPTQIQDRLLWRQLGIESEKPFTLVAVREVLLSRAVKSTRVLPFTASMRILAAQAVGARRPELKELRLATVRNWLAPAPTPATAPAAQRPPTDVKAAPSGGAKPPSEDGLHAFAERVLAAARTSTSGRFGTRKVFINHVYRALPALGLDEGAFKQRLVEANRARLLSLSRADLVEAMDPSDVAASEIDDLGSTFHFISL